MCLYIYIYIYIYCNAGLPEGAPILEYSSVEEGAEGGEDVKLHTALNRWTMTEGESYLPLPSPSFSRLAHVFACYIPISFNTYFLSPHVYSIFRSL